MGPCTLLQSRDPRHRSGGCAHNSSGVQVWEDLMHRPPSVSQSRCRQLCQTTLSRARGALMGTSGRTSMHGQVPMDAASLAACEARGTSLAAC